MSTNCNVIEIQRYVRPSLRAFNILRLVRLSFKIVKIVLKIKASKAVCR